ncbi:MAG: citramalate synthase [Chloroflexi bacterium]|nr:citramalate synthase [Chloroflexota bacterium]
MNVAIYDTTLRDGCQAYGFTLSVEDKLRVAQRLDALGFGYIEGGWPGSNPRDEQFFARARRQRWRNARLAAFGSTRRPSGGSGSPSGGSGSPSGGSGSPSGQSGSPGGSAADDPNLQLLLDAGTPVATIVGKASADQVRRVLGTTPEENLAMIADSVAFLKGAGREVMFDAEHFFDGYASDPDYALACLRAAAGAGADWVVLCDTNGGALPSAVGAACRHVRQAVDVGLGIHTHNDGELAVANALAAVEAGAAQVQGTINGYGERVGNANLCSIIPNLQLKMGFQCLPDSSMARLTELSRYVSEVGNAPHSLKLPYVGTEAFAHKAGLHVNAVLKAAENYEHVAPDVVGNRRRVLISDLSGRSNIQHKLDELGLSLSPEQTTQLLRDIKRRENQGMVYEDADASFELLALRALGDYTPGFNLLSYSVTTGHRSRPSRVSGSPSGRSDSPSGGSGSAGAEATVKVRVGREQVMAAAEGVGPVHALDGALRKALLEFYPHLSAVRLIDYKVRIVDAESTTAARVRVWIQATDGRRIWSTVGASPNIVSASATALVDSLDYSLLGVAGAEARERPLRGVRLPLRGAGLLTG